MYPSGVASVQQEKLGGSCGSKLLHAPKLSFWFDCLGTCCAFELEATSEDGVQG